MLAWHPSGSRSLRYYPVRSTRGSGYQEFQGARENVEGRGKETWLLSIELHTNLYIVTGGFGLDKLSLVEADVRVVQVGARI